MEENNNEQKKGISKYWKECLGMMLVAFIGGFLAIYFVADQVFDKHNRSPYLRPYALERQLINDIDRMYEREKKAFKRDLDKFDIDFDRNFNKKFDDEFESFKGIKHAFNPLSIPDITMDSVKINTEIENNKYKIIIGLKAFKGDDSRINYNVSGRRLTVYGNSTIKDKKSEQNISFSHDFLLPYNADILNISKKKDGNKLIITIPLKD